MLRKDASLPEKPSCSFELRLFGAFEMRIDGQKLRPMRSRAGQRLVALLLLHRDRPVSREWLSHTLWPDSSETQALYNLRRNLTDLRDALGVEAYRIQSPTPRTLQFDVSSADCDLAAFDAAIAGGGWNEAVRLYRGPLLQEENEECIAAARAEYQETFCSALEHLATIAVDSGDFPSAVHALSRLLSLDPFREATVRRLMQAYGAMGESPLAVRTFRSFRLALHENGLGEPDAQTLALYQSLHQSVGAGNAPQNPRPDRLSQQPKNVSSNRLPLPMNRLIGREGEINRLTTLLEQGARLVTLTGTGGVGKTRLAIYVADKVSRRFSDGAHFVDLAASEDEALVPQTVARVLGLTSHTGADWTSLLQQHCALKSLLLVLDNCEQSTDTVAGLALTLLQTCPGVTVLATSRQALGVTGERCCSLMPLSEAAATTLFMECTERALSWSAHPPEGATVQRIVRMIDCLPLAIEMAAAWTATLPVAEIAARLSDGLLSVRNSGSRTRPARQQTLDKTLEWSCALLNEAERALLGALSVFSGGWTLPACETICNADVETLVGLVDKSLVVFEENIDRYRLLETVREYARRRLQKCGVEEALFGCHADYFLHFAEEAEKHLTGSQQADWLNQLEAEHDNLRMALARSTNDENGLRIAGALAQFWKLRGYLREGSDWLARVLAANDAGARTATRARALQGAGTLAYDRSDYAIAEANYQKSLAIYRELGEAASTAQLLVNLGNVAYRQGDYLPARLRYEESLTLYRGLGRVLGIASALGSLGNIEDAVGNLAASHLLQEESLALSRSLSDTRMTAYTLHNLANLAVREGMLDRALVLYEESLAMKRTLGDRRGIAALLYNLGIVAAKEGVHESAARRFTEALTLAQEVDDKLGMLNALDGLAWQAAVRGETLRAVRLWGASASGQEALHVVYSQDERDLYDGLIKAARHKTPEKDFASAWAEGHAMLLEQAVREALESIESV